MSDVVDLSIPRGEKFRLELQIRILKEGLGLIDSYRKMTIKHSSTDFMDGANEAYIRQADLARDTLKKCQVMGSRKIEGVVTVPKDVWVRVVERLGSSEGLGDAELLELIEGIS